MYHTFSAELQTPINSNSSICLLISVPLLKGDVEVADDGEATGVVVEARVASLRGIQPRLTNTIALI